MYETENENSDVESYRREIPNIFEYTNSSKSSPLNVETSNTRPIQIHNERDIYSVEKELCSTRLDKIQEEEIVVQKVIEYFVPAAVHYKFPELFNTSPKEKEFKMWNDGIDNLPHLTPSIDFSELLHRRMSTDDIRDLSLEVNASGNSIKPVRSKSLTYLDSPPKRVKHKDLEDKQSTIRKYSHAFLNDERTLQELKQQNMLAQDLLKKYFKQEEPSNNTKEQPKWSKNLEEKKLPPVSSLMRRHISRVDENEQVCIKPSDEYVFLNGKSDSAKSSVKFVKPFKYHKKYWESGSNFEVFSKAESPFRFQGPSRKRSRQEFESNIALKQDSSTDISFKTQNVQFLSTDKNKVSSDAEANKLLFKTDSKQFENACSIEELHTFMPDRYMSLRNLYGCDYIESVQEQARKEQSKLRFNFQTLPNKNSKSRELVVKFFDSGSHVKVTDDEYRKWLKERDFLKYTDFAKSSVSSITFRSVSQKIVNYTISPFSKTAKGKKPHYPSVADKIRHSDYTRTANTRTIPSLTTNTDHYKFVDIEYNSLYQLVIYEHIVVSNVINFYCSFNATRIRKLTIVDRVYQLMFLVLCYYILSLVNNNIFSSFTRLDEKWF